MKKGHLILIIILLQAHTSICQQGTWEILKTKNDAGSRSECGLAESNGKLYLIGGEGSVSVEEFNPKTLTWNKKTSAPLVMHHLQAVSLNDKVYVLDAFSEGGFPDQVPMTNPYIYDVKKDSWQKGAELPAERRRAGAGAATYNGKLYLIAGIQHGHSSGTTNMFDEYDPQADQWTPLPDAPHIRDHCAAAVIKDKLYVVGGRNTSFRDPDNKINFFSQTVPDVDCYDFKTRTWTTLKAKLPLGSGGGSIVNLNGVLYYMGGERATSTLPNGPQKNVFYLDPSTNNEWREVTSLHIARNGMAAAILNNKIYVAGGAGGGPGGPPPGNNSMGMPFPNNNMPPPPPPNNNTSGKKKGSVSLEVFTPGKKN